MKLYGKDGKSYEVPHAVDQLEWKKEGFTENNPKSKDPEEVKASKEEKKTFDLLG